MPTLNLVTNVKIPNATAFALEFSKFGAETLRKPEAYIQAIVTYNEALTFAGTLEPSFHLNITSLDNINAELNEGYSKALFAFLHAKLGVPGGRGYVVFSDPGRQNIALNGSTVLTTLGSK